jgi:hypothetical protein
MFKILITTAFIAGFSSKAVVQPGSEKFNITGKWNLCYPINVVETCSKGIVTYDFNNDGSYALRGVKVHYADSVIFYGKWTLINDVLLLEQDNVSSIQRLEKLIFVNENKFYRMEEPLPGSKLYTVFQRVQ